METKQPNWLAIVLALALGGMWYYNNHKEPTVDPSDKEVVVKFNIDKTTKATYGPLYRQDMAKAFEDVAVRIEAGEFKYARELFDAVKPLVQKAGVATEGQFNLMLGQITPDEITGNEKTVAEDWRKVAKAWLK